MRDNATPRVGVTHELTDRSVNLHGLLSELEDRLYAALDPAPPQPQQANATEKGSAAVRRTNLTDVCVSLAQFEERLLHLTARVNL
jgi:hypothetical protein